MERWLLGAPRDQPMVVVCGDARTPYAFSTRFGVVAERIEVRLDELLGSGSGAVQVVDAAVGRACRVAADLVNGFVLVEAAYELAAAFEPRAMRAHHGDAVVLRLHAVGPPGAPSRSEPVVEGSVHDGFALGALRSVLGREAYERRVARAVRYVHAGDAFQTNLAHALVGAFSGSTRAAFASVIRSLRPGFAAYAERPASSGRAAEFDATLSLSPELFIHRAACGRLTTRPIKGTRRAGEEVDLRSAPKDRAELDMIIDLMRNDLGRVARVGSVCVAEPRAIERHHAGGGGSGLGVGVAHAVATVSADAVDGLTLGRLLASTFPPGSVTGAPKVRAMQLIDELERVPGFAARGAYCGAVGVLDPTAGGLTLNVAIRTATTTRTPTGARVLTLPVGAGVVADSQPASEWEETLIKARPIATALGATIAHGPSRGAAPSVALST